MVYNMHTLQCKEIKVKFVKIINCKHVLSQQHYVAGAANLTLFILQMWQRCKLDRRKNQAVFSFLQNKQTI